MSVVVRMAIPVNCDKCDLRNRCKLYVDYSWSLSDCFPTRPKPNPLDKGCLIICSLPEGHGRLVDADAYDYPGDLKWEPTIVPADEYPAYMSQWLGKTISAERREE